MADRVTDPRSAGPPVVEAGPAGGPAVVVLDPTGAAKHEELPPPWQEVSVRRRVLWFRLPVDGALGDAGAAVAELGTHHDPVDIVTSGPTAEVALELAAARPGAVRAVLLVDPAAPGAYRPEDALAADARWEGEARRRIEDAEAAGVAVRVVAHSGGGSRDRVPPPVPLGHPDLVEVLAAEWRRLDEGAG